MNKVKSPGITILLAILVTGLGHVYLGRPGRGALFFCAAIAGTFLFVIPGIAVFIYSIVDAHRLALEYNEQKNLGDGADREITDQQ